MLRVSAVDKSYASGGQVIKVLSDVSLAITKGNSLSIQGPSGCGKSTLLHVLGALDKPDAGQIIFSQNNGVDISVHALQEKQADGYRRAQVGFVFQKFNLIDCLSVIDNILLPSKLNNSYHKDYVERLIETMQIGKHLKKLPSQLSGGEQQRVAIARALAHQPSMVLADEPTGNLDEENSQIVSRLLFDTCSELQTTLVLVTHSAQVAKQADLKMHMQNKTLCSVL